MKRFKNNTVFEGIYRLLTLKGVFQGYINLNQIKRIIFLDSTSRDGGYYTVWDFNFDGVKRLIQVLNHAGIDIIEIGYKTSYNIKGRKYGLSRNCIEDYLNFVSEDNRRIFIHDRFERYYP